MEASNSIRKGERDSTKENDIDPSLQGPDEPPRKVLELSRREKSLNAHSAGKKGGKETQSSCERLNKIGGKRTGAICRAADQVLDALKTDRGSSRK